MEEQNFQNEQNNTVEEVSSDNYYQDYTQQIQAQPVVEQTQEQPNTTLAIVGLVLGIISLVSSCCGSGLLFGVGGLICSIMANKQMKTGMGTGGLICSIIGLVISVIVTIIAVLFYLALGLNYAAY